MRYNSSLQNQHWPEKKSRIKKRFFAIVFVLSLSLNVYFLTSKMDGISVVEGWVNVASLDAPAEPVETAAPRLSKEKVEPVEPELADPPEKPMFKVREVSFTPPPSGENGEVRTLNFKIVNSLNFTVCKIMSTKDCGSMSAYMARLLTWYFDVSSDIRKGDAVSLIYKKVEGEDRFKILKLEYDSGYLKRKLKMNFYKSPKMKFGSYFDQNGKEISPRLLRKNSPIVDYVEITSLPGDFRKGIPKGHAGTDFKAEVGTPVYASFDGRVLRTNWNRKLNGFCVELDHPREGVKTVYLHLNKVNIRSKAYVKKGQKIGETGNTGRSFAPHLHYEIQARSGKKRVFNPFQFKYHKSYYKKISNQQLPDFKKVLGSYESILKKG